MSTFSHIILTAPNKQTSDVYLKELESLRGHLICLQSCKIYSTSDPYGQRVGSGGGSLNALDYLVRHVVNGDIRDARIAIINSGGDSKRSPLHSICGKAWSTINVDINQTIYSCPMAFLVQELSEFCQNIPKGSIVVACSDVILDIFREDQSSIFHPDGITIVTVPEIPEIAKNHGVIIPSDENNENEYHRAKSYLQKPTLQKMHENSAFLHTSSIKSMESKVLIDTGVVIITGKAFQSYLDLLENPIIQKCTNTGLENIPDFQRNEECLRLELYSDMLLPLLFAKDSLPCTLEAFYQRLGLLYPPKNNSNNSVYNKALQVVWETLQNIPLFYVPVLNGMFSHLGTSVEFLQLLNINDNNSNIKISDLEKNKYDTNKMKIISQKYNFQKKLHVKYHFINNNSCDKIIDGGVMINSIIEINGNEIDSNNNRNKISKISLIEHSHLHGNLCIGEGAIVSHITDAVGKDLEVMPGIMMQLVPIRSCYWHLLAKSCNNDDTATATIATITSAVTASDTAVGIMVESESESVMGVNNLNYNRMAVLLILAVEDNMKLHYRDKDATVCGVSWSTFFDLTGASVESIWTADVEDIDRTLWNAKLYELFHPCKLSRNSEENMYLYWLQHLSGTRHTDSLHHIFATGNYKNIIQNWQNSPRVSLSDLLSPGYADAIAMHTWRKTLLQYTCSENNNHFSNISSSKIWKTYEWVEDVRGRMECLSIHQPLSRAESSQIILYLWVISLIHESEIGTIQSRFTFYNALRILFHKNRIGGTATVTFSETSLHQLIDLFSIKWKSIATSTTLLSSHNKNKTSAINTKLALLLLSDDMNSDNIGYIFMSILEHIRVKNECGETILSTNIPRVFLILSWLAELGKIPGSSQLEIVLLTNNIMTTTMSTTTTATTASVNESILKVVEDEEEHGYIEQRGMESINSVSIFYEILMKVEYEMQQLLLKFKTVSDSSSNINMEMIPLYQQLDILSQKFIRYHVQKSLESHLTSLTFTTTNQYTSENTAAADTESQETISTTKSVLTPIATDNISLCQCPARIDLAGGWSDTPPICYQSLGGAVLNVAVRVNNKRPIACASRFLNTPIIRLVSVMRVSSTSSSADIGKDTSTATVAATATATSYCFEKDEVICDVIPQSRTTLPLAPTDKCALLKACLIALGWSHESNGQFLPSTHSGLEVVSCSTLPPGSGLGGSSILAAAILRSLSRLLQLEVTSEKIVYLVSYVEQLLTTGGGWQDQVGCVYPGFKIARSPPGLPLRVIVEPISCSEEIRQAFNSRVYLLYTGTQRLAKNTLMNALKGFATSPLLSGVVASLVQEANKAAKDLQQLAVEVKNPDDVIDTLAQTINNYWSLKCQMAEGSEPKVIRKLLEKIRPMTVGLGLCGAGAGGYAVVIVPRNSHQKELSSFISTLNTELLEEINSLDSSSTTPSNTTTVNPMNPMIWLESVQLDQDVTDYAEFIPNQHAIDISTYLIDVMTC